VGALYRGCATLPAQDRGWLIVSVIVQEAR